MGEGRQGRRGQGRREWGPAEGDGGGCSRLRGVKSYKDDLYPRRGAEIKEKKNHKVIKGKFSRDIFPQLISDERSDAKKTPSHKKKSLGEKKKRERKCPG